MAIQLERQGSVALVTIDRPEALNALDLDTLRELVEALELLAVDDEVRCVVLTGTGDRAFVGGADIRYMSAVTREQAEEFANLGHRAGRLLETMPKPTIAAVNGFALGGGCELALACDLRYAAPAAKLGQPEINLGIIPGWGGTQRLARVCGIGVAKELILTGRLVEADEALRIGLVNGVHDPVLEKAKEVALLLASKSRVALATAKIAINLALQGDHVENMGGEAGRFAELFASGDAREGMNAFVEKREPRFAGR
jgi:enoyl-CoA hydratase